MYEALNSQRKCFRNVRKTFRKMYVFETALSIYTTDMYNIHIRIKVLKESKSLKLFLLTPSFSVILGIEITSKNIFEKY